jgi:hypothetical protein
MDEPNAEEMLFTGGNRDRDKEMQGLTKWRFPRRDKKNARHEAAELRPSATGKAAAVPAPGLPFLYTSPWPVKFASWHAAP